MSTPDPIIEQERAHENAWYARALRERFFEREGFRQLVAWNVAATPLCQVHRGCRRPTLAVSISARGEYRVPERS